MIYRIVITQSRDALEEIEADTLAEAEQLALENADNYDYDTMPAEYTVSGEWADA